MTADLIKALEYIHPSDCDYQTWVSVGMALKEEVKRAEENAAKAEIGRASCRERV